MAKPANPGKPSSPGKSADAPGRSATPPGRRVGKNTSPGTPRKIGAYTPPKKK